MGVAKELCKRCKVEKGVSLVVRRKGTASRGGTRYVGVPFFVISLRRVNVARANSVRGEGNGSLK